MADSTIKVPEATRDHLAALAKERGTTIGALVTALAAEQLTVQQADQRAREARRVLREQMGAPLTDAEFDATPGALDRVYEIAAEKARDALRGAA